MLSNGWFRTKWKGSTDLHTESLRNEKQLLLQEISEAHKKWASAYAQFDFALDGDQIDYAIFTLEAAEKRFGMLLKQAKELHGNIEDRESPLEVRRWSSNM
jgi:hypothetical protein